MSFIRMAFPAWWILDQPPEHNVGRLTTQMVELMQPYWAIAGWGVIPAVEERNIGPDGKGQQILYPYLQRFPGLNALGRDRKSTRLNSSHLVISYALFCLKTKNTLYARPEP